MFKKISIILVTMFSATVFAADCELTINRKACAGKETEAYKPYQGKNPTTESIAKAKTADECLKEAEKSSKIVRKGTLESKKVTATFAGKVLGEKTDTSTCK